MYGGTLTGRGPGRTEKAKANRSQTPDSHVLIETVAKMAVTKLNEKIC